MTFGIIHADSRHVPAVDPDSLFQRLVIDKQPCYCFGQNVLFMAVLKSLGYDVYAGLARSNFAPATSAGYIVSVRCVVNLSAKCNLPCLCSTFAKCKQTLPNVSLKP